MASDTKIYDNANLFPLHTAAFRGDKQKVIDLLDDEVCVNGRNSFGSTPLHLAAIKGHQAIVSVFVRSDADVNAQDMYGAVPLHLAASVDNEAISESIVRTLIFAWPNPNIKDYRGITPLHIAAFLGRKVIICLLFYVGAIWDCKDNAGFTPADYARQAGHHEVAKLLEEFQWI